MPLIVGYCRTSTFEQVAGFEAQKRDLNAIGAEKLFCEQTSAVGDRPELERALEFVREGDVFAVTKPCRLARSTSHLFSIMEQLEKKGVALRILSMNVDTSTPTGRLMVGLLGCISQFERELLLERQREGVAKAKAEGRYKGRQPTARAKSGEVIRLAKQGMTKAEIANRLEISPRSVFRVLSEASKAVS